MGASEPVVEDEPNKVTEEVKDDEGWDDDQADRVKVSEPVVEEQPNKVTEEVKDDEGWGDDQADTWGASEPVAEEEVHYNEKADEPMVKEEVCLTNKSPDLIQSDTSKSTGELAILLRAEIDSHHETKKISRGGAYKP